MKYNIPLVLLAAFRALNDGANAEFPVMPKSLIYLWPLHIRECLLLIGDGFYLRLTENPVDNTKCTLNVLMTVARVADFLGRRA